MLPKDEIRQHVTLGLSTTYFDITHIVLLQKIDGLKKIWHAGCVYMPAVLVDKVP